eukprot:snap_masked-scaffold71_size417697-processed-gene-3.0 protein:Tk11812 transcript:snap_masked-scaffold71_size417697-processed-gene-3.0-mRNA-1 annotation:"neuroligin- y-linked"
MGPIWVMLVFLLSQIGVFMAQKPSLEGDTVRKDGNQSWNGNTNSEESQRLPRTLVIQTKYGQVQGRIHNFESPVLTELGLRLKPVEVYQGIRYATPPIGSNRWQPTRAPSPWKGILQATSPGPVCPQKFPDIRNESEALLRMPRARLRYLQFIRPHLQRQSEDCLYLNLFVPQQDKAYARRSKSRGWEAI